MWKVFYLFSAQETLSSHPGNTAGKIRNPYCVLQMIKTVEHLCMVVLAFGHWPRRTESRELYTQTLRGSKTMSIKCTNQTAILGPHSACSDLHDITELVLQAVLFIVLCSSYCPAFPCMKHLQKGAVWRRHWTVFKRSEICASERESVRKSCKA